jgi:hypothetical protein
MKDFCLESMKAGGRRQKAEGRRWVFGESKKSESKNFSP